MSPQRAVKVAGFAAFQGAGLYVTYRLGGDWQGGVLAACAWLWLIGLNLREAATDGR